MANLAPERRATFRLDGVTYIGYLVPNDSDREVVTLYVPEYDIYVRLAVDTLTDRGWRKTS